MGKVSLEIQEYDRRLAKVMAEAKTPNIEMIPSLSSEEDSNGIVRIRAANKIKKARDISK